MIPGQQSQRSPFFFLAVILLSLSVLLFQSSITLFPSFIHAWTQSDRYALALGFLNNGFDFFHPRTYNLATLDGITRVDFPIHEYLVALLMKISGYHEPLVFRLYTLIYALTGLFFLFRLALLFSKDAFRSLFVVLFLFSCPVYLYYADGFIPSIPSLSNLWIGYFYYFRFRQERINRDFRTALLFLTLAALARLPYFIFLFAVICQQIVGYFQEKKGKAKEMVTMGISLLMFLSYQLYNHYLGKTYGTQFLVSFLPAGSIEQVAGWIGDVWNNWRYDYFTSIQYYILGILILPFLFLLLRKRISLSGNKEILLQLGIASSGSIIYFFLMLQQFPDHDYYFIDSFYPVVSLLIIVITDFSFTSRLINRLTGLILGGLLFLSFREASDTIAKRYETGSWDRVEITRKNFEGSEAFLDSIGIAKDAKVLVLDGYTTNVPLILMNRNGWTVNWTTGKNIEAGMSKPFDLVAIQHSFAASDVVKNDPSLVTRLEKFADNGTIGFYRRKENPGRTRDQFFGIDSASILFEKTWNDSLFVDGNSEFKELFSDSASWLGPGKPVKALVTGQVLPGNTNAELIASSGDGSPGTYYFSFNLGDYAGPQDQWQPLLFQFVFPARQNPSGMAKIYFWNKSKIGFSLVNVRVVFYR